MARNVLAGIDLGDYEIKIAVAEMDTRLGYPRLVYVSKSESRGIRRGSIIDQDEVIDSVGEALELAERGAKQRIRRALITVNGSNLTSQVVDGSVIVSRADSEITDYDIKRTLDAAESKISDMPNKRVLDVIPLSYKLDGKKLISSPKGMKGSKLEIKFLYITCLAHHLDELVNAVEKNRVSVENELPSPIAASYVAVSKAQKIAGCVLADIGAGTTSMAVFEEGLPQSVNSIDLGSQDITNDIALGLKVSLEEAEDIKLDRGTHMMAKKKIDEIIEARLSDIFELIDSQLQKLNKSELLPAGIIITGGGAFIPKIDAIASAKLNIPAKISYPLFPQNIKRRGEEKEDPKVYLKDPSLASAYGLVVFGQNPHRGGAGIGSGFQGTPSISGTLNWFRNFLP